MSFLQNGFADVRQALAFFTLLPLERGASESGGRGGEGQGDQARSPSRPPSRSLARPLAAMLWAAPLAGLVVAVFASAAFALAGAVGLSPVLCALFAVLAAVLVTGALHEDGLADMVDGFGGGRTVERKLAIMKDSAIGTYGVVALVAVLALRGAALVELAEFVPVALSLLAAHMASRALLPAFMKALPAVRAGGLSQGLGRVSMRASMGASGLGLLAVFGVGFAAASPLFVGACLLVLVVWFGFVRALALRQIGGHTGDVLGFVQQGAETLVLLVASATLTGF